MPDLKSPLKIDDTELRNRLVMPPMAMNLATKEGEVTEKLVEHYRQRAKHTGMIIVEHSYVDPSGKLSERQLGIYDDDLIPGLKKIADAIKGEGCFACIQITHAGGSCNRDITGKTPVSPSKDWYGDKEVRELTIQDMDEIKDKFSQAARRAKEAGFQAVEVHGAHGFLLNQFTSPLTNKRDDGYGGSLENRIKYPLEVVDEVKKQTEGMLLMYRMGACDEREDGFTLEDAQHLGKELEDIGVKIIDVSGGFCGSRPEDKDQQGYYVHFAEKVKSAVDVPVVGVGGIVEPEFADKIVKEGRVDLAAVGRALLKDPRWGAEYIKKI